MDEQFRQSKHSYKISIESRKSNLSSCRSLERPSWGSRQNSLSKNHSFVEVMSLQSGRKSDIYQKMLQDTNKPKLSRQSMGVKIDINLQNSNYNYFQGGQTYQIPHQYKQRNSQQEDVMINHTCKCYTECQWQTCPCLQARNELCIKGYCCVSCINLKRQLLMEGNQIKMEYANPNPHLFCTCKKTKCNKKYCSCFAAGVHCSDKCSCQGCINCVRKSEHNMEVEQEEDNITEQMLAKMEMPGDMDFQPFQYNRLSNN